MKQQIKWLIIFICSIVLSSVALIFFTGFIPREETGISHHQAVLINNTKLECSEVAKIYLPKTDFNNFEKPLVVYYDIQPINQEDAINIIYRYVWQNETHPNLFLDTLYKPYRAIWYGSFKDIEPILVKVSTITGEIINFSYESPTIIGHQFVKHNFKTLTLSNDGFLNDGGEISFPLNWKGTFKVTSWNHLFEAVDDFSDNEDDIELRYLDDSNYKNLHIERRSDLSTIKTKDTFYWGVAQYAILLLLAIIIFFIGMKTFLIKSPSDIIGIGAKRAHTCPNCGCLEKEKTPEKARYIESFPLSRGDLNLHDGKWRTISSNIYGVPFWNKWFGVTRTIIGTNIYHKIVTCNSCQKPYDLFCSTNISLRDCWPHLFSCDDKNPSALLEYDFTLKNHSIFLFIIISFLLCLLVNLGYNSIYASIHGNLLFFGLLWSGVLIYLLSKLAPIVRSQKLWHDLFDTDDQSSCIKWSRYFVSALFGSKGIPGTPFAPSHFIGGNFSAISFVLFWSIRQISNQLTVNVFIIIELLLWTGISFVIGYSAWVFLNVGIVRIKLLNNIKLSSTPDSEYRELDGIYKIAKYLLGGSFVILLLPIFLLGAVNIHQLPKDTILTCLIPWFSLLILVASLIVSRYISNYLLISILIIFSFIYNDLSFWGVNISYLIMGFASGLLLIFQWNIFISVANKVIDDAEQKIISCIFNSTNNIAQVISIANELKTLRPRYTTPWVITQIILPFTVSVLSAIVTNIL